MIMTSLKHFCEKKIEIKGGSVSVIAKSRVLGSPAFASKRRQQRSQATNRCFISRQDFQRW